MANTKLTVTLIPKAVTALEEAARITGDTQTDTINRAIQFYAFVNTELAKGKRLFLQDANGDLFKVTLR